MVYHKMEFCVSVKIKKEKTYFLWIDKDLQDV